VRLWTTARFLFHLLDLPATAVLYTWLFLRRRGSALPAVLLHATSNAWTAVAVPVGTPSQLAIALAAKWLLVIGVIAVWSPDLVRTPHPQASTGPAERSAER
jgi:hypothetical protein